MATFGIVHRFPGGTKEQYEAGIGRVHPPDGSLPEGQTYHAAGATAIFENNPFERRFRDIHSVAQQLQGRQQHFETVGQHLMGLEADTGWL